MIPWNLIGFGLKEGFSLFRERAKAKSEMKHKIAMEEIANGNIRAKRAGSLILDMIIGVIVLTPFTIQLIAGFYPEHQLLHSAAEYINNGIRNLPKEYWYGFYMVVGGNFGISVSNVLANKNLKIGK